MRATHLRTAWASLVQALVEAEGQGVRARLLLECVAREPWVVACGLWRRERPSDSWSCLLVRGAPDLLHEQGFIEEVAAGRMPHDLVAGRGVLLAGQSAGALALTYAGSPADEFDLDLFSGLLQVLRLVDAAELRAAPAALDALVPALPHSSAGAPECEPGALLRGMCTPEFASCARARIQFELEIDPSLAACRVALSAAEFRQAVLNLVSNAREALEHAPEGGRIHVSLMHADAGRIALAVEDTGPGLPQAVLEALDERGPEALPGPGLGLAVSWGIALSAGGELRAGAASTQGARIELLLPIRCSS